MGPRNVTLGLIDQYDGRAVYIVSVVELTTSNCTDGFNDALVKDAIVKFPVGVLNQNAQVMPYTLLMGNER